MGGESFDYPTMARALILGDRETVARKTQEGLALSMDPKTLIFKGLIPGMDVVGEKFRRNEYYVPQVLLSARAMYAGLDLLKPLITASARAGDTGVCRRDRRRRLRARLDARRGKGEGAAGRRGRCRAVKHRLPMSRRATAPPGRVRALGVWGPFRGPQDDR